MVHDYVIEVGLFKVILSEWHIFVKIKILKSFTTFFTLLFNTFRKEGYPKKLE